MAAIVLGTGQQPAEGNFLFAVFRLVVAGEHCLHAVIEGRGNNYLVLTSSILRDSPKSIAELRAEAPVGLQRIVDRCLAKSATERYSSMRELYGAVNRLRLEITAAPRASSVPSCPQQSIAVLPFINMSADQENEFFADGITEEIINALAQIPQLHVAARTSSFPSKASTSTFVSLVNGSASRLCSRGAFVDLATVCASPPN